MGGVRFFVKGKAQPAGSKRAFGSRVVDANPNAASWKNDVRLAAGQAYGQPPVGCPVSLVLTFYRTRPKSHFHQKAGEYTVLRPAFRKAFPTSKPDALKLARGVEDALTGVIYVDDAQVVSITSVKAYGDTPGVQVDVLWLDASCQSAELERRFQPVPPLFDYQEPPGPVAASDPSQIQLFTLDLELEHVNAHG